jgi:hypothetical protein
VSDATNDLEEPRQQVDAILEKAKADEDYRAQVLNAPQDTPEEAGLSGWAVDQLVFNELGLTEVGGFTMRNYTDPPCGNQPEPSPCREGTCLISINRRFFSTVL